MTYFDRIRACNHFDPAEFVPFVAAETPVGAVRRDRLAAVEALAPALSVDTGREGVAVRLDARLGDFHSRTAALDGAARTLVARGELRRLKGEAYAVSSVEGGPPLFALDRAAVPYFGVRGRGLHVNGFVRDGGRMRMWVARRARTKSAYPGKLDNMVAGGQPMTLTLLDNLVKEAFEEASIPPALARQAVAVGEISYCVAVEAGLRPDVIHCFDLELPADFVPIPHDGEVERFHLLPVEEVLAIVRESDEFKFNCALVVIDFALRHGFIAADDPDESRHLREALHRPVPFQEIALGQQASACSAAG